MTIRQQIICKCFSKVPHTRSFRVPCSCSPKKCPFNCHLNIPLVMSGLCSWTGREFRKRGPVAAEVFYLYSAEQ